MQEVIDPGVGGVPQDPPRISDPPKSKALDQELRDAKTEVLRARDGITGANLQALTKKLEEANKALKDFSHGNLVKQIEEQHKNLKTELIAAANMIAANQLQQQNKAEFEAAVQQYLNKRLEMARVRLQEITNEEKQTIEAFTNICTTFRSPTGATGKDVMEKFGTDFNHIERTEGHVFKSTVQVKYENGILSSKSPKDLAMAARAKGWNSFEFKTCKISKGGVDNLLSSMEEMLKVGIKDVRINDKLWERIHKPPPPTGHSSGDYAAQLASFIKNPSLNITDYQKKRLQQMRRICAASTSAYREKKGNPVFDQDGNMIAAKDAAPSAIDHQVETFLRLTSLDDRRAYMEILFPLDIGHNAAKFVNVLNERGKPPNPSIVFPGNLSPEEYFRTKILGPRYKVDLRARQSEYDEQRDRDNKLKVFNEDATTPEQRKKSFLASNDESLLRRYALSKKLDGPNNTNDTRVNLVKEVFRDVQATVPPAEPNPHAISLYNRRLSSAYTVREDDKQAFLLKTLALFENIKVLNAAGDATDFNATAQVKTQLIRDLREEAQAVFLQEKNAGNPAAYDNFYKNKILIDELEERMLDKHFTQQKKDTVIPPGEEEQRLMQVVDQHLHEFYQLNADEAATAFVLHLSPELQQHAWKKMDHNDPNTAKLRARILEQYIEFYQDNPTPAGLHFLNSALGPLMKNMTREIPRAEIIQKANELAAAGTIPQKAGPEWTPQELEPVHQALINQKNLTAMEAMTHQLRNLCLRNNINGTKPDQNKALTCIRDNIVETNQNYQNSTAKLQSTELFKEYFNSHPGPTAAKLLEVLKCYGQVRSELSGPKQWLLNRRFRNDMRELLYPANRDNMLMDGIINNLHTLKAAYCPNPEDKPTIHFINQLHAMSESRPENAPNRSETDLNPRPGDAEDGLGFDAFERL